MKILFVVPYPPGESPSQRFRFEQYLEILRARGDSVRVESFLDSGDWRLFYNDGKMLSKISALVAGSFRRVRVLVAARLYDFVFVHREAAPAGPPLFEWIIARVFRKKIIYDFDDAIWLTDKEGEPVLVKALRWRRKVNAICAFSHRVSCGNPFLASYAASFNARVVVNPTTVDTIHLHNPALYTAPARDGRVTIGWTGSRSTLKYLGLLVPTIRQLERRHRNLRFMVIADKQPGVKLDCLVYRPWSLGSEIKDLLEFDIGIMPLPDDEWTKGKCGFKMLQYMALGIPAVASPVGINTEIIEHGTDGFLAATETEWTTCLETLIAQQDLRAAMGKRGREKVMKRYSVLSNTAAFLSLFE